MPTMVIIPGWQRVKPTAHYQPIHHINTTIATAAAAVLVIFSGKLLTLRPAHLLLIIIQERTRLHQAAVLLQEAAAVDQVHLQAGRREEDKI